MATTIDLEIQTPRWALPLLEPKRFKGARGGRGGGKSHLFAELLVEEMLCNPDLKVVCIREIQKSLRLSVKSTIEAKIHALGIDKYFNILTTEIRRQGGEGLCIFQGMQDHTADSIKSLEGFDRAWVEEAQSISDRSLTLLLPTIRKSGSEVWFSWNPEYEDDAVDRMWAGLKDDPNAVLVEVNLDQNPFADEELKAQRNRDLERRSPEEFAWIWQGDYKRNSEAQVLAGKWKVRSFEPKPHWNGAYFGADWGFASHPTALIKFWIFDDALWVEYESYAYHLELDKVAEQWRRDVPGCDRHTIRADSAQPANISYVRRNGIPGVVGVKKWSGSVEDGINHLRSYRQIYVHPRCTNFQHEARRYSYKVDRYSGDVLPAIVKVHDHLIDALRYGLEPMIQNAQGQSRSGTAVY